MRKIIHINLVSAILLSMLFLCSCQNQVSVDQRENTKVILDQENNLNGQAGVLTRYCGVKLSTKSVSDLNLDQSNPFNLPEMELENITIFHQESRSTGGSETSYYLLGSRCDGLAEYHTYLLVETEEFVWLFDLKSECYEQNLYICDVDGDSFDEIIVQQTTDHFGGAGHFLSRIFKFEQTDSLFEMFNSATNSPRDKNNQFDTGYDSEFLNGYNLKITNKHADCNTILDISGRYIPEIFDEDGKCTINTSIWCDGFLSFTPKDVDDDDVFEIECLQYVSLLSHVDGIGYAKSVLKYNANEAKFEVVRAEFITEI